MKKITSLLVITMLIISCTGSAFAVSDNFKNKKLIRTENVVVNKSANEKVTINVYDDNGITLYTLTGGKTKEAKAKAIKLLDEYMLAGKMQQKNVYVNSYNTTYWGQETGTSNYASCWTNVYYKAGNVGAGGTDKTWGTQRGAWSGMSNADYIKLHQQITISVNNADSSLGVAFPFPYVTVSSTTSKIIGEVHLDPEYGVSAYGADHATVTYDESDLSNGRVEYCKYTDTADVNIGSYTYRPTSSVKFIDNI